MSAIDELWSDAMEEAMSSAPEGEVRLRTIELRHPAWDDEVRIVADPGIELDPDVFGWALKLEDNAPAKPGRFVRFVSCMFDFDYGEQAPGSLPEVRLNIDNAAGEVIPHLDLAVEVRADIEITYREFLVTLEGPQFILNGLILRQVNSSVLSVTGTAKFASLLDRSFPNLIYKPKDYKGLNQ